MNIMLSTQLFTNNFLEFNQFITKDNMVWEEEIFVFQMALNQNCERVKYNIK